MHISGILVRTAPGRCRSTATLLDSFPGVEVDRFDETSGSIVVVQEIATREGQEESLRRIQRLPGVAFAELVCHFVDSGDAPVPLGESVPNDRSAAERSES